MAYAVNSVNKYLNNHNVEHWRAVKRIISAVLLTTVSNIETAVASPS